MLQKCTMLFTAILLSLVLATSAQAVGQLKSLLAGSGAQFHIGNGLALPIQAAFVGTGSQQPTLLIPRKGGVDRPVYVTAMAAQAKITLPVGVLRKDSTLTTVGVYTSNTAVYAVGTALTYEFPAGASGGRMFSTGVRSVGDQTHTYLVGAKSIRYSPGNLAKAFGGAARGKLSYPGGKGLFPGAPVSVYLVGGGAPPACHHTIYPPLSTASAACRALMVGAYPSGLGAIGATPGVTVMDFGLPPLAAVVALSVGLAPPGTLLMKPGVIIAAGPALVNAATSVGYPWTAGRITIDVPSASPMEHFTLSGTDMRNANGNGMISMVAGSLSDRTLSGPNANRGWLKLVIGNETFVPALSTWGRVTAAGFIALVALGYAKRARWATAS